MIPLLPFALVGGASLVLATVALWTAPTAAIRSLALAGQGAILAAALWAYLALLGMPKPVDLEFRKVDEATVLSYILSEDEAIYLWLAIPGLVEPVSYVMPWDRETAEQIEEARRKAEEGGGRMMMRHPFEPSLDDREPRFYPPPRERLPDKVPPEPFEDLDRPPAPYIDPRQLQLR